MTTEEKFRAAVNVIKNLPKNGSYQPSHDLMLRFYAYFKQATEGPCKASRPAFWEVVKKMKWDAWSRLGNMPREEAMESYVHELKTIVETMSYTDNVASFLGSLGSFYDRVPAEDLQLLVGPVIERMRSQPGSPLSASPFGSREASPSRASDGGAPRASSLDPSPASSYSASPQPPDAEEDEDEEEFKDTLESAPERVSRGAEAPPAAAPATKPPGRPQPYLNGLANGYVNGVNGVSVRGEEESKPAAERSRNRVRNSPPARPRGLPPPGGANNNAAAASGSGSGSGPGSSHAHGPDVSQPVAAAVARLQQDLQQAVVRLAALERAVLARAPAQQQPPPARRPRWWPLPDLSPAACAVLFAWPLLLQLLALWLRRRRAARIAA